ncbi:hypothetical protein [Fulvivirga ligni]|uniref:hypothetical protein n=1 Tax=Fulvivirga ligni TaxID=2904246 RepID=UPI001F2D798B|nr:hypothetical protein [Fulvivirga ligni]UII21601.1 hypothetical protein LVD16_27620 [Fulvivirga ligni]
MITCMILNGNMIRDLNKGIDSIYYNHLDLPSKVKKIGGEYILYTYDAAGIKLAQTVYDAQGQPVKRTDYSGEYIYQNDTLLFVQNAEGRIVPNATNGSWEYQYHLKDHLGNTRLTFTSQSKTWNFVGTFESENGNVEESTFEHIPETRMIFINADANNDEGNEVVEVNNSQPMGAGISLPISAGDQIDMSVYGYYEGGTGYNK